MAERLRAFIPAPPAQPPRYGIIAAAPIVDDPSFEWLGGFAFTPEQCGASGRLAIECAGGTDAIDVAGNPGTAYGDPFLVWAGDECSTLGSNSRDFEGRARRQLEATQSFQIAEELWTGSLRDAEQAIDSDAMQNRALVDIDSDTVTDGPASEMYALSCVEQALATATQGRRGMIHVTVQLLTHLFAAQAIMREGNLWVTVMGNIVVADAGYDGSGPGGEAAGDSQWMYGTSIVQLRLGPVEVIGELASQVQRSTNLRTVVAQRPAAFAFDECAHVAAEVDLPVCAIQGAS